MLVYRKFLLIFMLLTIQSKVNGKCGYEGKCQNKILIYEVQCLMCDAIYMGNTQHKIKKRMDGHFYDILRLLKKGQK